MLKVRGRPYSRLRESATKVRRCAPNTLRRKIGIRARRNIGSRTSMWATKIDAIQAMREICESQSEVRMFLGACAFYHIWIPHYAHIADPLYHLLRKGKKLEWKPEHTKAMKKLKKTLRRAEALKKPSYDRSIIVTVDTSPTGIGWVINQPIRMVRDIRSDSEQRFSTKGNADMHKSKENYGESAIKSDQDYLIGAEIVIETDCLLILGMMRCCTIPDVAMLRWIAYVKSLNPEKATR